MFGCEGDERGDECGFFDVLATLLGQVAPVSADDVQSLELLLDAVASLSVVLDHQGGILLLLQQQKSLEHAIDVDLQQLVQLVHFRLHLGSTSAQRRARGLTSEFLKSADLKLHVGVTASHLVAKFEHFLQRLAVGVDHDGVGVSVDDFQIHLPRDTNSYGITKQVKQDLVRH